MNPQIVSCSLPERLVAAIDRHNSRSLASRADFIRAAIFEKARADGLLKRSPAEALDLAAVA